MAARRPARRVLYQAARRLPVFMLVASVLFLDGSAAAADKFGLGPGGTRLTKPDPPSTAPSGTGFGPNTGFGPGTGFGGSNSSSGRGSSDNDGTRCVSYWCPTTGRAADCQTGCPHPQGAPSGGSPAGRSQGQEAPKQQDPFEVARRAADAALSRNDLDAALGGYEAALRLRPTDAAARARLAQVKARLAVRAGQRLLGQNRLAEAAEQFRRALALDPGDGSARASLQYAEYRIEAQTLQGLFEGRRWPEAEAFLRGILQKRPNDAIARLNLAVVLRARNKLQEAQAEFERVLRIDPGSSRARRELTALNTRLAMDRARGHYEARRFAEANSALLAGIQADPAAIEQARRLAAALRSRGDLAASAAVYQTLLAANPGDASAREMLDYTRARIASRAAGMAYDQGRWSDAAEQYRRAAELRPKDGVNRFNQGLALEAQGKLETAIAAYEAALRIDPNYAKAREQLARARHRVEIQGARAAFEQQRWDEAERRLRRAMQHGPDLGVDHYNLGVALERQGKRQDAAAEFEAALRFGNDPNAQQRLEALRKQVAESPALRDRVREGIGRALGAAGQLAGIQGDASIARVEMARDTDAAVDRLQRGFDSGLFQNGGAIAVTLAGLARPGGNTASNPPAPGGDLIEKRRAAQTALASLKEQRAGLDPGDGAKRQALDKAIADTVARQQAIDVLLSAKKDKPRRAEPPSPKASPPPAQGVLERFTNAAKTAMDDAVDAAKRVVKGEAIIE